MAQSKKTWRHSFSDAGGSPPPLCRADWLGREEVGEKKEEVRAEKEEERVEEVEVIRPIPDPCGILRKVPEGWDHPDGSEKSGKYEFHFEVSWNKKVVDTSSTLRFFEEENKW